TFAMGGLATWAPAYFVRERGIPLAVATSTFGGLLVVAGFLGTLIGGRLAQRGLRAVGLDAHRVHRLHPVRHPLAEPLRVLARHVRDALPALREYRAAQCGDGERAARRAARARLRPHHHADASARRRGLALAHRRGLGFRGAQDPGAGHGVPALAGGAGAPDRTPYARA